MTDIISASLAGLSQVIVGHPFDTMKVLVQNKKSIFNLKLRDYYRGAKYPLFSSILFNSIVFSVHERTLKYTESSFLSGVLGGIVVSPILFAFDTGKIKTQTQVKLEYKDFLFGKGKKATLIREGLAMGISFSVFESLKKDYNPLVAGALAGLTNWTTTYTIDVVKSRQISQQITMIEAINQGNLWRGYPICAFRSLIVNAAIFYTYETTKIFLDKKN